MKTALTAGVALMMLAGALPSSAYHTVNTPAPPSPSNFNSYYVGSADVEVLCESYGIADPEENSGVDVFPFPWEPVAHAGVNGICFMSSNVNTRPPATGGPANCRPGTVTQVNPIPADDCAFSVRPVGSFTTFHLVQTAGLPDVAQTRTGNVYFRAGSWASGLLAGAGSDGACVSNNYSDVSGYGGGHVVGWVPAIVVFFGAVSSVPVVVLNALPDDAGIYTTDAGPCAASLSEDVGGLGVLYVNPIANSGTYLFEQIWQRPSVLPHLDPLRGIQSWCNWAFCPRPI